METIDFKTATTQIYQKISSVNFADLAISNYNKEYIKRLTPALLYYLNIYTACLEEGLSKCNKPIEELTFVDYGGGSGFLSMLAKQIGIGKVVYIDLNEKSVETISILKQETGIGPDIILHGDSSKLQEWCRNEHVNPDLLIGTDVIEHIYDLSLFFDDLVNTNENMQMVFTTASTPYNPFVIRRLHRFMRACEEGRKERPNYYTKRFNYIRKRFPKIGKANARRWAVRTRGLNYCDIEKSIQNNERPLLMDAYNTFDPETGNWAERILSVREYTEIVKPYGYHIDVKKGFYNEVRPKQWKSAASILANQLIKYSGKAGFVLAPFILLSVVRE